MVRRSFASSTLSTRIVNVQGENVGLLLSVVLGGDRPGITECPSAIRRWCAPPFGCSRTRRGRDRLANFRGRQQSYWHFRKQSALMRSYPWVWQRSGGGRDGILACYDSQGEQITQHSTRPQ
jgi:hypothetical protein